MNDSFDGGLVAAFKGLIGPMIGTVLGMAWGLADDVRAGRPFTRKMLLTNALTAGGLGVVVGGIGDWFGLPLLAVMALGAIFGKLGTDWLLLKLLPRFVDRWLPPRKDGEGE